jgi:Zn-dependent peptidase ImmA (M78 family)/DNA-binding XRE family transcriptional regulator
MLAPRPFTLSRLTWARRRRGLDQVKLARLIGTSVRSVKAYEAGEYAPAAGAHRRIARELGFPERFFTGDPIDDLIPTASFRARTKLPADIRDAALGSAAVAIAFNSEIERLYALPKPDFPNLGHRRDAEQAANFVRLKWHVDDGPIDGVMQLLESKGVRIFSLPADAAEADTFSLWHHDRPFILLNTAKREDEQRLDLAHELGHLLLHRGRAAGPKTQQAANAFASAFLMPAAEIRADVPRSPSIEQLIPFCRRWGMPLMATAHRLHELELLSDWRYRQLRDAIAVRHVEEEVPAAEQRESSLLLQRVFSTLRSRGLTKHKIASSVHIYPTDLDGLVFGLALKTFDLTASSDRNVARLPPRLTSVRPTTG